MLNQRKAILLERLLSVQRMRRISAEAALAEAQEKEREACAIEKAAHAKSQSAQEQWLDYIARPRFSPELGRGFSSHLLECDEEARRAASTTIRRAEITSMKEGAWQQSEAQVRLTETATRRLRRSLERKREEKRLGEISDRLTFIWSQT